MPAFADYRDSPYRVPHDAADSFELDALPTDAAKAEVDKKEAKHANKANRKALTDLQERLYAGSEHAVLVVLQAIDAGGKDSTIRRCLGHLNPQGVRVQSFKQPSSLELSHDFLWRYHQHAPVRGNIGVFNRSHYESVLVERVKRLVPEPTWRGRYEQINAFEQMLVSEGTIILKFFLHLSRDEQAERFRDRLVEPEKWWKFSESDLEERARWPAYQSAFRDALAYCSTPHAPWYAVPADQKWYRDYVITGVVRQTLERLDLQFPTPAEDTAERVKEFLERLKDPA